MGRLQGPDQSYSKSCLVGTLEYDESFYGFDARGRHSLGV